MKPASFRFTLFLLFLVKVVYSVVPSEKIETPASFRILKNIPGNNKAYNFLGHVRTIPRCGETHHTSSGTIFYKPFEEVLENERCAWIVSVPGAVGYTVSVEYLGSPTNEPNSGQKLVLTGVQYNGADPPVLTTYSPTDTGTFLVSDANSIVVTFQSSTTKELGTGFYLQYQDIQTGNISRTSISSVYTIFDSPLFKFRHPPSEDTYTDAELSVFLFPPGNSIFANHSSNIYYGQNGIQSDCRDSLFVYTFHAQADTFVDVWQNMRRICSDVAFEHIPYDDMVLILFQSDLSTVGNGFWFWYTGC